jgi:hypothetical protein
MVSEVRDHVLALAALRHGLPAEEVGVMDRLPSGDGPPRSGAGPGAGGGRAPARLRRGAPRATDRDPARGRAAGRATRGAAAGANRSRRIGLTPRASRNARPGRPRASPPLRFYGRGDVSVCFKGCRYVRPTGPARHWVGPRRCSRDARRSASFSLQPGGGRRRSSGRCRSRRRDRLGRRGWPGRCR